MVYIRVYLIVCQWLFFFMINVGGREEERHFIYVVQRCYEIFPSYEDFSKQFKWRILLLEGGNVHLVCSLTIVTIIDSAVLTSLTM